VAGQKTYKKFFAGSSFQGYQLWFFQDIEGSTDQAGVKEYRIVNGISPCQIYAGIDFIKLFDQQKYASIGATAEILIFLYKKTTLYAKSNK
jgi:hypothetical protein